MALGLCFPARRTTGCISANNCIKPNGNIFAVHEVVPFIRNLENNTVLMILLGLKCESEQLVTLNKVLMFRDFIESHFYAKKSNYQILYVLDTKPV